MALLEWAASLFVWAGVAFISAGTVGLLRFPDVYTRLHALAKVDNLGLGCIIVGLLLRAREASAGAKLVLVWLLVVACSSVVSFLIARRAYRSGVRPWEAP